MFAVDWIMRMRIVSETIIGGGGGGGGRWCHVVVVDGVLMVDAVAGWLHAIG